MRTAFVTMRGICSALVAAACYWAASPAVAQQQAQFPAKPIRLLIGFAPGGNTDVVARTIAKKAGELLGQPFIIENKPGAGGSLAGEAVATAPADGYTLLVGTLSTQVLNVGLIAKPRFNVEADFAPIALTNQTAIYFGVPASLGARTLAEFVAKGRARTGAFNYGAPSIGGVGHLAAVIFNRQAGIAAEAVVYKGSSPAVLDLAAGRIEYLIDGLAVLAPQVASSRVALLGVSGKRRNPDWPDVPTFTEAGYPELSNLLTWNAWFAPVGTPKPVVAQLNKALLKALADPDVAKALQKAGNDVSPPMGPDQVADFLAAERKRWLPVMKEAGVKPE